MQKNTHEVNQNANLADIDTVFAEFKKENESRSLSEKKEASQKVARAYCMGAIDICLAAIMILLINDKEGTGFSRFRELIPQAERLKYFESTDKGEHFRVLMLDEASGGVREIDQAYHAQSVGGAA